MLTGKDIFMNIRSLLAALASASALCAPATAELITAATGSDSPAWRSIRIRRKFRNPQRGY